MCTPWSLKYDTFIVSSDFDLGQIENALRHLAIAIQQKLLLQTAAKFSNGVEGLDGFVETDRIDCMH